MSQERTEPYTFTFDETEQMFMKFFVENSTHTLTVRGQQEALADLLTARREIDRLNAVIAGQAEAIREQTAKVQERDREIKRSSEIIEGQDEQINKQAEEIERLWSVGESIICEAVQMGYNDWDEPGFVFEEKAEEWRAALKGAE